MLREQCIQHVMCCCVLASQNPHECPRCISLSCPAGAVGHFSGFTTVSSRLLFESTSRSTSSTLTTMAGHSVLLLHTEGLLPALARFGACLLPFSEILQSARLRWSGGIPGSEATVS
eukprot:m.265146 g.265146  ORF g.265146 m.265146 type:complete len:117 (-) comp11057_c0_seq18:8-358(-)